MTTTTVFKHLPQKDNQTFMSYPLIEELGKEERWTISSKDKVPIDARHYLDTKQIRPAKLSDDSKPLVTLDEINKDTELEVVNRAYRLNARNNRTIMIDVEPKADIELLKRWLNFPANYTEVSKNGGVHLLIQIPERFMDQELEDILNAYIQLRDGKSNEIEYLFNDHYITFTKKIVSKEISSFDDKDGEKLKQLITHIKTLAEKKTLAMKADINISNEIKDHVYDQLEHLNDDDVINIFYQEIFENSYSINHRPSMNEKGDYSEFEYMTAFYIVKQLILTYGKYMSRRQSLQKYVDSNKLELFTEDDIIHLTYLYLEELLEERSKWKETRNGLPWLLYTAKQAYSYAILNYKPQSDRTKEAFKAYQDNIKKGESDEN